MKLISIFFTLLIIQILIGCGDATQVDCWDGCSDRPKDGLVGKIGQDGSNGQDGTNGNNGLNGNDGAKGDKGDQGNIGPVGPQGPAGIPGTSCIASPVLGGANIYCGFNPPVYIANGSNGVNGTNGVDGVNGTDGTNGSNGNNGSNGSDGTNGIDGAPGLTGPAGNNGTSCSVTTLLPTASLPTGGAQITCGVSSAIVVNGAASGAAAAYTVVGSVDPCGSSGVNNHDEVFFRLASGQLVAVFVENASALTARLSYVMDGLNYQTTDSQHCIFSISTAAPIVPGATGERTITYTSPVSGNESWHTY